MIKYDRVLIVGDFNIHVCCPEKPLVKAFLNLVESFNLTQSVVCPTHICGHTLDLVLTYGLPISNINVCDATFSDHLPVLFEICTSCDYKETAPKRLRRIIKPTTSHLFSEAFNSIELDYLMPSQGLTTDELTSSFFLTCQSILDTVAPFRTVRDRCRVQPWLNTTTRAIRLECRKAERRWKKDKLQISLDILRYNLSKYQKCVRLEKSKYLSNIISSNSNKPSVLFTTINSVLNTPQAACLEPSAELCEQFLNFLIDTIDELRSNIVSPLTF